MQNPSADICVKSLTSIIIVCGNYCQSELIFSYLMASQKQQRHGEQRSDFAVVSKGKKTSHFKKISITLA